MFHIGLAELLVIGVVLLPFATALAIIIVAALLLPRAWRQQREEQAADEAAQRERPAGGE